VARNYFKKLNVTMMVAPLTRAADSTQSVESRLQEGSEAKKTAAWTRQSQQLNADASLQYNHMTSVCSGTFARTTKW
jgi:hypothetical protein